MGDNIPNGLQLINTVYSSVCSDDGRIYLGLQDGSGIIRLGELNAVVTVTKKEKIQSFTVYNSKIYALIILSPPIGPKAVNDTLNPQPPTDPKAKDDMPDSQYPKVRVYALNGNQEREWTHTADGAGSHSQLTIVNDRVAILCVTRNRVTTYSLDERDVRSHIPHEGKLGENPITEFTQVCAAGGNCLVFSDYNSHQVVKFNLTTKKVIWRCKDVCNPRGVTHYKDDENEFILVTDLSPEPTVHILDIERG